MYFIFEAQQKQDFIFTLCRHLIHQIHLPLSSSSVFTVTGGIEQFGDDDAAAQCNSFSSLAIVLVYRVSKLVFSSSRHLNAFMTASFGDLAKKVFSGKGKKLC